MTPLRLRMWFFVAVRGIDRTIMRAGAALTRALLPVVGSRSVRAPGRPSEPGATGLWRSRSETPGRRGLVDTWCVKSGCAREGERVDLWHVHEPVYRGCHAGFDGDCSWDDCPQLRDGEPVATGRHCPLDSAAEEN